MDEPIPTCEDCGRKLRTPESRARKVGPVCWRKANPAPKRKRRGWVPRPVVTVRVPALEPPEDDALLDREVCGA